MNVYAADEEPRITANKFEPVEKSSTIHVISFLTYIPRFILPHTHFLHFKRHIFSYPLFHPQRPY